MRPCWFVEPVSRHQLEHSLTIRHLLCIYTGTKQWAFVHRLCLILTNWSLSYKITWFHHVPCKCKLQLQWRKYKDLHKWLYLVQRYVYLCGTCQQVTPMEWKQNVKECCDISNMPYGRVSVLTCLCCYLSLAIWAESRPLGPSSEQDRNTFCVNSSWEWQLYVMMWYSVQPTGVRLAVFFKLPLFFFSHRKCHVLKSDVSTCRVWIQLDARIDTLKWAARYTLVSKG